MRIESQYQSTYVNSSSDNCIANLIYLICELFLCLCPRDKDDAPALETSSRTIQLCERPSNDLYARTRAAFDREVEDSLENLRERFASRANSIPSHETSIDYDQISRAQRAFEAEKRAWENLKELPQRLHIKSEEIERVMKESTERLAFQSRLHNENIIHGSRNPEVKELNDQIFNEEMKRIQDASKFMIDFFTERTPSEVFDGLSYDHFQLSYKGDGIWTFGSQIPMTLLDELFHIETYSEGILGDFFAPKVVPQMLSDDYALERINRDSRGSVINIQVKGLKEADSLQIMKKRLAELLNQMES